MVDNDAGSVVLVPLDGSKSSEAAIPYAEALARVRRSKLRLFTVVDRSDESFFGGDARHADDVARAQRLAAEEYLREQALRLEGHGCTVTMEAAEGSPAAAIARAQEDPDVWLTVMSTRGRGGLQRWMLGSVTDKVVRKSTKPVLVVSPRESRSPAPPVRFERIVVALDGSPFSEAGIPAGIALARATGAKLTLVRAQPLLLSTVTAYPYVPELPQIQAEIDATAQAYLREVRSGFPDDVTVDAVMLSGSPAEQLIAFAEECKAQLVIMTTHGRGGVQRLALGSTTDRVIRAGVPVLIVRPESDGAATSAAGRTAASGNPNVFAGAAE
jgi:nucleotide-binding universal stress UspA family protein